jgi:hypothetical protein
VHGALAHGADQPHHGLPLNLILNTVELLKEDMFISFYIRFDLGESPLFRAQVRVESLEEFLRERDISTLENIAVVYNRIYGYEMMARGLVRKQARCTRM